MGQGPVPCVAMIIGEAPGAEEEKLGAPFVGPSGKLLDEALNEAGANRDEFYVTNVYKYRPPENRDPTLDEVAAHADLLREEFDAVNPRFVLVLGRIAGREFAGKDFTFATWRGRWALSSGFKEDNVDYLFTFHPAATIYDKTKLPLFMEDVATFVEAVREYESPEHSTE